MIPRRVRWATLLAFVLQGIFILTARYRLSYDAYNHMFFGDHYRLDWWTLWEPRWYAGFEIVSYPPLVHQIIGLLGHLIGVEAAFGLLLWVVLAAWPLAIYRFSRIFTGKTIAGYAAFGAAILPSLYETAHTFGQLPTLTGGLFALFGFAALNEYLRNGGRLNAALTVSLFTVVMAAHHATLLFLPFALAALLLHLFLNQKRDWKILLPRLTLIGILSGLTTLIVIWPFWAWGWGQAMQTPINHPSRHNFFLDPIAPLSFFLPVYGPLILLIPFVFWKGFHRKTLGLWGAFLLLFLLGLGGTTPLPRWLFGPGWEWLTYDRFALWASWLLLPFLGMMMVIQRRRLAPVKRIRFTRSVWIALGLASVISGLLPTLLPTQPPQVDMQPLADFLAEGDHAQWRYVTFGFGDQFASLSLLTSATTIDGSYHTARALPELRSSGIGQIDTTYWLPNGFTLLEPVLQSLGKYGVRWGFVNRADYIPILERNGWIYLTTLSNQAQVWENPAAQLPPPLQPPAESPWEQFSWGVFPLLAFSVTGALALLKFFPARGQQILLGIHAFCIGILPIALCFWYYRPLALVDHPRVYFTYDSALFFLSDAFAAIAVLSWALARFFGPKITTEILSSRSFFKPFSVSPWFAGLCLLSSLSILWSQDWRTSMFISLHWWLVFGLFLSLQNRPESWRFFALGSIFALLSQVATGLWQFQAQSTAFLAPLGLNWPGDLTPATQGASVVQLADGARWLRIYGTLPHPTILGGLVVVFLAGLAAFYLCLSNPRNWLPPLFGFGVILLVLTFSRSAWLGLAAFGLMLLIFSRHFECKRLLVLLAATLICIAITVIPLRDLIITRSVGSTVKTETFSTVARTWLATQGWAFFREYPLGGVGIGAFIITLSQRAGIGYIIEPVHNIPLLAASELGLGGFVLLLGLTATTLLGTIRVQQKTGLVFFAALVGLFTISLFDHYLWTLAPGRVLLGTILGLWAGQARGDELSG